MYRTYAWLVAAAAAAAALALTTTSAAAQNVTIVVEDINIPCPAVSGFGGTDPEFPLESTIAGGCTIHAINDEGSVRLTDHIFGLETTDSVCTHEFTLRIGGNGEGFMTDNELAGASCARRPCTTAGSAPEAWTIHMEETTSTAARAEVHVCLQNLDGSGRETCHAFLPLTQDGGHVIELGVPAAGEVACEGVSGFRPEVSGHWVTELGGIEVLHSL